MGGTEKAAFDGRIRGVWFDNQFVLVRMLCLLFALFLLVSEQKHLVYMIANNSKYIASCFD